MNQSKNKNQLLTVCIPTYRRPYSVLKSVSSVLTQIDTFSLQDRVNLTVADDYSGDNTGELLREIHHDSFSFIARTRNLGMSLNLYSMVKDIKSKYILILTDDDWLQNLVLRDISEILEDADNKDEPPGLIWTPRYSYLENGGLYCIETNPYKKTRRIKAGSYSAGRNARNGFILSGLMIRRNAINFDLWKRNIENGYFPVLITGEVMTKATTMFWKRNIVHHTVMNQTHWHRWGSSAIAQHMRLHYDFLKVFDVLSEQLETKYSRFIFDAASILPRISNIGSYFRSECGYNQLAEDKKRCLKKLYNEYYTNMAAIAIIMAQYGIRLVKRMALTLVGREKNVAVELHVIKNGLQVLFSR